MVPGGIVKEIRDTVNAEFAARGLRDVMNRMENW